MGYGFYKTIRIVVFASDYKRNQSIAGRVRSISALGY